MADEGRSSKVCFYSLPGPHVPVSGNEDASHPRGRESTLHRGDILPIFRGTEGVSVLTALLFLSFFFFFSFVFLPFLGLLPWHVEVPRLGVNLEL